MNIVRIGIVNYAKFSVRAGECTVIFVRQVSASVHLALLPVYKWLILKRLALGTGIGLCAAVYTVQVSNKNIPRWVNR